MSPLHELAILYVIHYAFLRVNSRDFLLGFAVLQALPGPLFNFSVFLGVLTLPSQPVLGGFLGCLAIFLPGIVLKMGLLPLYIKWRSSKTTRSILRGLNAAAVGLVCSLICFGRCC
jgi:chromate transport protein ChrA